MVMPTYSPHPNAPAPKSPRGPWRTALYVAMLVAIIVAAVFALRACAGLNS